MTTLVPQDIHFAQLAEALARQEIGYDELLAALAASAAPAPTAPTPRPEPKSVVLAEAERKALRTLPRKIADAQLPGEARLLSETERAELIPLFDEIKAAKAALVKAEEAFKTAFHGHLDTEALAGDPDQPVNEDGHTLTRGEVTAAGLARKVVRDVRGGATAVAPTDADLVRLVEDGVLTRQEYLNATKAVPGRVPVPEAIMALLARRPELLGELARRVRLVEPTLALRMAKA